MRESKKIAGFISSVTLTKALVLSSITASILGPTALAHPATDPGWAFTGSLNTRRNNHTATVLPNGKVLVAGGNSGADIQDILNSAELYDPATGTWSLTGSLNVPRYHSTATLLPNGKVLVAGGISSPSSVTATAELYDPATGTWSLTGNLNTTRFWHSATLLRNGRVLIAGGHGGQDGPHHSAELYDPASGTWSITGRLRNTSGAGRMMHTATLLQNGKVLVVGGIDGDDFEVGFSSAELYNPDTGTWSVAGSLSTNRALHTATLLQNGKVLVVGGSNAEDSAELYDPATDIWSHAGTLSRYGNHTATLLPSGQVLIAGGANSSNGSGLISVDSADLYDPHTGMWSNTASLNTARYSHTATSLQNGKVLVVGGVNSTVGMLDSGELYDPDRANGKIAYSSGSIHVMNGDGSNQTKLTNASLSLHAEPAWSPDGSKIAFSGNRDTAFDTEIYVINADGTNQINVTNDRGLDSSPAWSPDGTRIAFTRMPLTQFSFTEPAIFVMNADGSNQMMLTDDKSCPHGCTEPSWSPDGTKIVFATRTRLVSGGIPVPDEIFVMNSDGSNRINLTTSGDLEGSPSWSPDGTRIAFTRQPLFVPVDDEDSGSFHETEIFVMDANGSNQARLTNNIAADFDPAWSPDGTKLAFASSRDGNPDDSPEIYVMNADGSSATRLTNNPNGFSFGPAWQAVPTTVNPIDDAEFFITQQYKDFLRRLPEPGPDGVYGTADDPMRFYLNILNGCNPTDADCLRYTRGALSGNFFRSPEFQRKGSYVMYLYMVSLGQRPSTVSELSDPAKIDRPHYAEFMADLESISTPNDDAAFTESKKTALADAWMQRVEIQALYPQGPTMTNAQFVQKLLDTAGVTISNPNQLIQDLNNKARTRAQVLRIIAESAEVNTKFYKQAFVTMEYFGYLRRDPEDCHNSQNWTGNDPNQCGFIFHNNRFNLGIDQAQVENVIVRGFIESPEYRQRFGP